MNDLTSGTYDLSNNTKLFRGLDAHEINASGSSTEDSLGDYFKYGIGDAAVSAGVGLLNTATALGEVIGLAGPDSQIKEGDAINSLLGADAASFYGRHKTGIDAAGFVGSSLIPGLASIRVLRMAQTAGKIGAGLEAATGLRNADIVMNSGAVEAAKKFALSTTTATPNWFSTPMIRAYAQGFKQQLMESVAFEAGNLALNNQNASINPDDLGYFTAVGDQFWNSAKFAAIGGVLGGAVDAIRIAGSVRKFGSDEWTRVQDAGYNQLILHPNFDSGLMTTGSKLLDLGQEAGRRAELEKTIAAGDWFARKQFDVGSAQLKTKMLETFGTGNEAGSAGLDILNGMVKDAGPGQLESMSTILSGMENVASASMKDLEDLRQFYSKTRAPITVAEGDSAEAIADLLAGEQKEFARIASGIMQDPEIKGMFNFRSIESSLGKHDSVGYALSGDNLKPLVGMQGKFNARLTRIDNDLTAIFPDFAGINSEKVAASYNLSKEYNKRIGKEFNLTQDEFHGYVMMHELAHIKNNPEKMTTLIQNTFYDLYKAGKSKIDPNSELGATKTLVEQLVTASVRSRENKWFSSVGNGFEKLSEKAKVSAIMKKLTTAGNKELEYLGDPAELLADGAAYMTRTDTRELAAKHFPELAKMFDSEGSIAKAWNPTKAYYNARTKQVYSSYLPGIVDVDHAAKVSSSGVDTVLESKVMGRSFKYNATAFSEATINAGMEAGKKLDYLDYDANWIIADRMGAKELVAKDGTIQIAKDNIAVMEKVGALYKSGDSAIVKAFDEGKVSLGGSPVQAESLHPLVRETKEELRRKLAISSVGYNEHEIAKILNVDLPVAYGDLSAAEDSWHLIGTKDYTKPELFVFNYAHRNIGDYQGAVMNMTGVSMINDAVKSQVEAAAAELTGPLYSKLLQSPDKLLATVNPFNSRAGLLTNTRAEMGSLREWATYTGKQVAEHVSKLVQRIDESYLSHGAKINERAAVGLRFELAHIDNLLKREQYYLAKTSSNLLEGSRVH